MFMTMLQHTLLPMKLGEETPEDQGQAKGGPGHYHFAKEGNRCGKYCFLILRRKGASHPQNFFLVALARTSRDIQNPHQLSSYIRLYRKTQSSCLMYEVY